MMNPPSRRCLVSTPHVSSVYKRYISDETKSKVWCYFRNSHLFTPFHTTIYVCTYVHTFSSRNYIKRIPIVSIRYVSLSLSLFYNSVMTYSKIAKPYDNNNNNELLLNISSLVLWDCWPVQINMEIVPTIFDSQTEQLDT